MAPIVTNGLFTKNVLNLSRTRLNTCIPPVRFALTIKHIQTDCLVKVKTKTCKNARIRIEDWFIL